METKIKIRDGEGDYNAFKQAVEQIQPRLTNLVKVWNNGSEILGPFTQIHFSGIFSGKTFEDIDSIIFERLKEIDVPLRRSYSEHFEGFKQDVKLAFGELERSFKIFCWEDRHYWPLSLKQLINWPIDSEGKVTFNFDSLREEFDTYLTDPAHISLYHSLKQVETSINTSIDLFKSQGVNKNVMMGMSILKTLQYNATEDRYSLKTDNLKFSLETIIAK